MQLLQHKAINKIRDESGFENLPLCTELTLMNSVSCITMQTFFVDTVLEVGPRMLGWSDMKASIRTVAQWLRSFGSLGKIESTLHRFARTLIGGPCREHDTQTFHDCPLLDWLSDLDEDMKTTPCHLEDMVLATDNRVFFTTKNGGMGLGPPSTQSGDQIITFPSGCTNFILRPILQQQPGHDVFTSIMLFVELSWTAEVQIPTLELVGDCYFDAVGCAQNPSRPDGVVTEKIDDLGLEGSLPYEILGAGYLEEVCPEMTMSTVKLI